MDLLEHVGKDADIFILVVRIFDDQLGQGFGTEQFEYGTILVTDLYDIKRDRGIDTQNQGRLGKFSFTLDIIKGIAVFIDFDDGIRIETVDDTV